MVDVIVDNWIGLSSQGMCVSLEEVEEEEEETDGKRRK